MKKVLLHVCCGICGLHVIEKIRKEFGEPFLFFYNPNIQPKEEYERRRSVIKKIAEIKGLWLVEGAYETAKWFLAVTGLEKEPEGGERCAKCFRLRLEESARKAKELNCEIFATTLTISPHKSAEIINAAGKEAARKYDLEFIAEDFKKENGFKKTMREAKERGFYRQNYCGCIFSIKNEKRKTII